MTDRARGYHPSVCPTLDPPDLPRFALLDGPSPLRPLPRLRRRSGGGPRSGSSARTSCRSPSVATSCATWSSWSALPWPRAPTRSSRRDALVQPLPADGGRRGEGGPRRPPCPVRTAGRPAPNQRLDELLGATVHVAATDDRVERERLVDRSSPTRAPGAAVSHPARRLRDRRAVGQVLAGPRARGPGARGGIHPAPSSCRPRPAAPRQGCWPGSGLAGLRDTASVGSR